MSIWMQGYLWGVATPVILAVVALVCGLVVHLLRADEVVVCERHGEPEK